MRELRLALGRRLREARGSMTILTTGVLVVILGVIAVGTSVTGVHLERNRLQHAADSAALAASQALDPGSLYGPGSGSVVTEADAERAARDHLMTYPLDSTRTEDLHLESVEVEPGGTVRVQLSASSHPPLAGWFTRGTGLAVPLTVHGEARAR